MRSLLKSMLGGLVLATVANAEIYQKAEDSWIADRVEDSKSRLSKTEGGRLLWASIEAHGGLDQWFSNGLLKFRWTYNMRDRGAKIDTTQTIDTWSALAIHQGHGSNEGITFGWDGKDAWLTPEDAKPMLAPRFWALTPYYFVGVPHVLADQGTIHEKLKETLTFEGVDYDQVKVTYEANTGDSPDDYYIVLIHPETKCVRAVRYIVTHPIVTKGKTEFLEKMLTYEDWTELSGVLFPKSHRSFVMDDGVIGKHFRDAEVSGAEFLGNQPVNFSKPD